MSASSEIIENVSQVRNATYGKDVREAIARSLELCYGYTSGETAIEAAERANAAAAAVEAITDESRAALVELEQAVSQVDDIVKVSATQPTEELNKIWIQPQDDTEYKVATYAAYELLWSRMNEITNTYQQGHGGVVSIVQDTSYVDPEDQYKRRYVVTYSDEYTDEFFVNDGETGPVGPTDSISETTIYYHKGIISGGSFVPTPPTDGWTTSVPSMNAGDYLWTQTVIEYESGAQGYIYGLTRWGNNGADGRDGIDGTGAVNSVAIGTSGTPLVGDIVLPLDSEPTEDSSSLISSGAVYEALQNAGSLDSPAFTGMPTAPTAASGTSSTQIATTAFVQNAINEKVFPARQVTLTMDSKQVTYLSSSITENTSVIGIVDIDYSKLVSPLTWETSAGQLKLSTGYTPKSSMTLKIILLDTVSENT